MNANQLLDVIGEVKTEYLFAAMATGEKRPARRNVHKIVLIAAVVSLMVLLLGCAIVALNLNDLKMEEISYTHPLYVDQEGDMVYSTEIVLDVISLQGMENTPEFQAAKEWFDYEWSVDPNAILNDFDAPEDYAAYLVGNQEMQDKLDEICAKYNLKLLGPIAMVQQYQWDTFYEALGIESLLKPEAKAEIERGSGYFYANGNFKAECFMNMTDEAFQYPHQLLVTVSVKHKGYLDPVVTTVGDVAEANQRNYMLPDGTEILIVTVGGRAHIFCDREDAFVSVDFEFCDLYGGSNDRMTDREIELVAEALNFTVKPQKPDIKTEQEKLAQSEEAYLAEEEKRLESYVDPWVKNSYRELIESLLQDTSTEYTYGFADLDGDGTIELLIGDVAKIRDMEEDEKFCYTDSFTMKDGKTTLYFSGATATYLCENNRFVYVMKHPEPCYGMYTLGTGENKIEKYECLYYYGAEGKWFYNPDGEPWPQEVTEEVAMAILDSYVRIPLEMKPIREYPMD